MSARGERTFSADGRDINILFTNRALATAERRIGKSIVSIAQGMTSGELGIGDLATLLHVGMEAARVDQRSRSRSYSMDDAYQVLDDAGFAEVAGPVVEAIAAVISYAPESSDQTEDDLDPND